MLHWGLIGRLSVPEKAEHSFGQSFDFTADAVQVVTLKAVDVKVTVRGFTARVDASITYQNDTNNALEVEYRMPIDDGAAVYKFEAVINGRKITAQCLEKKKAEKIYKDAVQTGHTAILGREDDSMSDIFHLALGNIPAGAKADLQLSMMMELKVKTDGAVSFTLPTVLNPRYCPAGVSPHQHTASVAQMNKPETAVVSRAYLFGINAKVQGGHTIARITSHKDNLNVKLSDDSMSAEITQDVVGFQPDHDWNMLIYYANPYKTHIIRESGDRSGTGLMRDDLVMVNLHPQLPEKSYSHRNEILFIVDCSGSMGGGRIQSARATLLLFLKSLPTGCYFNIICFGSTYFLLFPEGSKEYNEETLQKAMELYKTIDANMGGTEILQPLKAVYSKATKPGFARQILLLTDGEVFNVDQVKELVSCHADYTRVFTVGIGEGASTALVHGLARSGRGISEMVYQQDKLQVKVMGLVRSMLQESVQDVKISFEVDPPGGIKLVPKQPPTIFGGQHLITYVRLPASTEVKSFSIKGVVGDVEFRSSCNGSDVVTIHDEEKALHRLAARAQINEWQINNEEDVAEDMIALSLATGVVCRQTAFVGVDLDMKPVVVSTPEQCSSNTFFGSSTAFAMQKKQCQQVMRKKRSVNTTFGFAAAPAMQSSANASFGFSAGQAMQSAANASFGFLAGMEMQSSVNNAFGCSPTYAMQSLDNTAFGFSPASTMDVEEDSVANRGFSGPSSSVNYEQNLMAVVSLQKFDGSWTLEDAAKITSLAQSVLSGATSYKNEISWGTCLVLAFLETKYLAEKDEWILLANKARMVITRFGDDVEVLLLAARKFLAEN